MPSNIPLWTFGVAFRLRLVTFTEQAHPSYRHLSGIPAWRDIHQSHVAPSRDIHRARSPRLQASRWQIALLGILLEGLSGNRHRLPHQEPSHNRSPAVLILISGHVLVHCPFREPMPPATVCHLSATGTPTASWFSALGRRPKTISRRDVSPRPRRRRGSLRSGAQPSSPAPFRRE